MSSRVPIDLNKIVKSGGSPPEVTPDPATPCPGFTDDADRCWRMVYDQSHGRPAGATYRAGRADGSGRRATVDDKSGPVPDHLDGLTGVREQGAGGSRVSQNAGSAAIIRSPEVIETDPAH